MHPIVILTLESFQFNSTKAAKALFLAGAMLLASAIPSYPALAWAVLGCSALVLGRTVWTRIVTPNHQQVLMGFLQERIGTFQIVHNEFFEGRYSPTSPNKDFTITMITMISGLSLESMRDLLQEHYRGLGLEVVPQRDDSEKKTFDVESSKGRGCLYEVSVRSHPLTAGVFRIRVTRI